MSDYLLNTTGRDDSLQLAGEDRELECKRCGRTEVSSRASRWVRRLSKEFLCGNCVRQIAPALSKYLDSADVLQETADLPPFSARVTWNNLLGKSLLVCFVLLMTFVATVYGWVAVVGTLRVVGVPALVGAPVLLWRFYLRRLREGRRRLPRQIRIVDGFLVVERRNGLSRFSLADIQWHDGSTNLDPDFDLQATALPAIIMCCDTEDVACGQTDDMREVFRQFCLVARIRRKPWCSFSTAVLVVAGGAIVSWAFGTVLGHVAARLVDDDRWIAFLSFSLTVWGVSSCTLCVFQYLGQTTGAGQTTGVFKIYTLVVQIGLMFAILFSGPRWFDLGLTAGVALTLLILMMSIPLAVVTAFVMRRAAAKANMDVIGIDHPGSA